MPEALAASVLRRLQEQLTPGFPTTRQKHTDLLDMPLCLHSAQIPVISPAHTSMSCISIWLLTWPRVCASLTRTSYLTHFLFCPKEPANSRSTARQKLTRLTRQQFQELSTDVYDELVRRKTNTSNNESECSGFRSSALLLISPSTLSSRAR